MSTEVYRREAKDHRRAMVNMQQIRDQYPPGTIGYQRADIKVMGFQIQYFDAMYDMYSSLGNDKLAFQQRRYMEQIIAKKKQLEEWMNSLPV